MTPPAAAHDAAAGHGAAVLVPRCAGAQGLTLVHFSAQRKRFGWVEGYIYGLCRGFVGGIRGCLGCILCQKRLRLSREVDESKALPGVR